MNSIHKYQIKLLSNMEHNQLYYNEELSNIMFENDICYFDNEKDYDIAVEFLKKIRLGYEI
jgi:hypothetical protein